MTKKSDVFVIGNDLPEESGGEGIRRQILGYDESLMLVRNTFTEGAVAYIHSHEHVQVAYVESGEFDVVIGGAEKRLGPGDCFFVDSNIEHGAVCRKAGVLIDVFNPAREDFLAEAVSE